MIKPGTAQLDMIISFMSFSSFRRAWFIMYSAQFNLHCVHFEAFANGIDTVTVKGQHTLFGSVAHCVFLLVMWRVGWHQNISVQPVDGSAVSRISHSSPTGCCHRWLACAVNQSARLTLHPLGCWQLQACATHSYPEHLSLCRSTETFTRFFREP